MHDGSIATLVEVIDHYAEGGRAPGNPNKSSTIRGFRLTPEERADLIEFLKSLTDEEMLKDPRWSSPWRRRTSLEKPANSPGKPGERSTN